MHTDNKAARIAGILYLVMALCSMFSMLYVDSKLYVTGDAAATVANILASERLYRMGFVSNLVGQVLFLFLIHSLYKLLRSADRDQAGMMIMLVVASVPIACLNMMFQFAPIVLFSGAGYLSAFNPGQLQGLAMAFLELQKTGVFIAEIFWGLWLVPFGLLVIKSGLFPKALGVLLMLGCAGYLIECLVKFLFPGHDAITYPGLAVSAIAEFTFIFWLLFKGVKVREGHKPLSAAA